MVDWSHLPDLLLGNIFSYLSTSQKLFISEVCPQWAAAVWRPDVWNTFSFCEDAIVLRGEETNQCLEQMMKQKYLNIIRNVGKHFQSVKLHYSTCSGSRVDNSNEIINCLAENCFSIKLLKIVKIYGSVNVVKNHQTASKQAVYRLIKQNTGLQFLDVKDLDTYDSTIMQRQDILPLGAGHSRRLQQLFFIQSFQGINLSNLMYLVNLKVLAIEPNVLNYSLLYHLAGQALTDLHIVALSKHTQFYNETLQNWQWKEICSQGPHLRVHCHFGVGHEWTEREIILKKEMPVKAFRYQKDHLLHYNTLSPLLMNFSATLEVFIDLSFSMIIYEFATRDSSFPSINVQILNFVRACPKLRILVVKEVLLSSSILAMLACNRNLEIILMEDQLRYDSENILLGQTDLSPALSADVIEVISQGRQNEESFLRSVKNLRAKNVKVLRKQDFVSLMLEKYVEFTNLNI